MKRIIFSIRNALHGITYVYQTEKNMKIHLLGFIFMNLTAYFLSFSTIEYILCFVMSALVFSAELINTAIEKTIDRIGTEIHPLSKAAKDCAAGAVLILAIASVIVWGIIVIETFRKSGTF